MQVDEIMTRVITACRPEDGLNEAARIMWESDCGCVPVLGGNGVTRAVGIVTDRDICMAAYTTGKSLGELTVAQCMTTQVVSCAPDDSVDDAERLMREAQIRRLPVQDADGVLVGMLSLADLARETAPRSGRAERGVTDVEVGTTLSAISQPRRERTSIAL